MVYTQDPFAIVIEVYPHSYELQNIQWQLEPDGTLDIKHKKIIKSKIH
ncbi:MAG: hypothetical protein ICV84_14005 [Flavisolibacter sp.]|nr:hypothetical protein [Flavisolibacter sp.]